MLTTLSQLPASRVDERPGLCERPSQRPIARRPLVVADGPHVSGGREPNFRRRSRRALRRDHATTPGAGSQQGPSARPETARVDPDRVGRRGGADHPPPGKAAGLLSIAGRAGFLYVADCKLATCDNMEHIASGAGGSSPCRPAPAEKTGPRGPGDALGFCLYTA